MRNPLFLSVLLLAGSSGPLRAQGLASAPWSVRLTQPDAASVYGAPGSVQIAAELIGAINVSPKVEFYSGATKLGESTAPPYAITWTGVAVGRYWLTAVASDAQGHLAASDPVEIAVTGPDCGSAPGQTNTVVAGEAGAAQIYFGQDVSPYAPFGGPNQVPRPFDLPLSRRAAASFLARLPGGSVETFERFGVGSVPTTLTFGTNAVTVSGDQAIVEVTDPNGTSNGEFPISGTKGLELVGDVGSGFLGLDFTTPQAAFGFYATDLELNGLNVTVVGVDGTNRVFTVPVTIPQGSGGAVFWGVIDKSNPFVHVELTRTGNLEDSFLFDDLTLATPAQVWPEARFPTVAITDAAPVSRAVSGRVDALFPVMLSQALSNAVTLEYFTLDGSARSGVEYAQTNGVVLFAPGQTNATARVQVLPGQGATASTSFGVQLRNAANVLLGHCQAQGSIVPGTSNPPPVRLSVAITSPAKDAVFCPGADLPIAASVQSSGSIKTVEIYQGTSLLASLTQAPFRFVLDRTRVSPGDYFLSARVTDDQGNSARSEAVRVAVSADCGDVAIVRSAPDPEIDQLVGDLFEIGLNAHVFDLGGLTFEMVQPFQTIIWDDVGSSAEGLTDDAVRIFSRAQGNGSALYLIGAHLAASITNLTGTNRTTWTALTHLTTGSSAACDGLVHLQASISNDPIVHGRFGLVDDFNVADPLEPGQMTGTGAEVIGRCGTRDVLIAYPGFEAVDTGQARVFTQNTRVYSGTDPASLAQRKALFQNVLCWLHGCECSTFDVNLQASGTPDQVKVGDPLSYTVQISHTGECEATGTVLVDTLPAGMVFVGAQTQQGNCVYDPVQRAVICDLGHLAKSSTTTVTIQVSPTFPGTWTNAAVVRVNGEGQTNNNFGVVVTSVSGSGAALSLGATPAHQLQLHLNTVGTGPFLIQSSADLRTWTDWQTNLLGSGWSLDLPAVGRAQFYRARTR